MSFLVSKGKNGGSIQMVRSFVLSTVNWHASPPIHLKDSYLLYPSSFISADLDTFIEVDSTI